MPLPRPPLLQDRGGCSVGCGGLVAVVAVLLVAVAAILYGGLHLLAMM